MATKTAPKPVAHDVVSNGNPKSKPRFSGMIAAKSAPKSSKSGSKKSRFAHHSSLIYERRNGRKAIKGANFDELLPVEQEAPHAYAIAELGCPVPTFYRTNEYDKGQTINRSWQLWFTTRELGDKALASVVQAAKGSPYVATLYTSWHDADEEAPEFGTVATHEYLDTVQIFYDLFVLVLIAHRDNPLLFPAASIK